ncbi:MAG TPA: HAD family hydrolase [Bacteroidia bacterium]|nr:HAD family hydrolase [Bacteroidia bacterium]
MKNKAIFLDRDGVINRDVLNYTWRIEDFVFLPGVFETCREFKRLGFLIVVVTNQGGIAKGMYTHEDVDKLHAHMKNGFSKEGIELTEIYYCPHHEITGKCLCRKPGSLLVEKALARFNIDPKTSFFIGDRDRDILAAEGAGVKGILVPVNTNLSQTLPIIQ